MLPGLALVFSLDGSAPAPAPAQTFSVADVQVHSECGEVCYKETQW